MPTIKEDMTEIKANQKEMTKAQNERNIKQGKFEQKMEDYMEQGMKEHELLFTRTKGIVKWSHLISAVFVLGTIVGIMWKLVTEGAQ